MLFVTVYALGGKCSINKSIRCQKGHYKKFTRIELCLTIISTISFYFSKNTKVNASKENVNMAFTKVVLDL